MVKKIIPVQGMHCSSCEMLIEGELEDIGVSAHCSYQKQRVEVEFDPQNVTEADLAAAIQRAGYSAQSSRDS